MADVTDRDERESRLARMLAKLSRSQVGRLLAALGDPPRLESVPQDLWDEIGRELQAAIAPHLEQVYLEQAQRLLGSTPLGVDWTLTNSRAVEWARTHAGDLVRKLTDTNRQLIRQSVSAYYEQGQTIGDLQSRLERAFGPVRAEMIAVTEVTRAASEGEQELARELREQGIEMTPVWQTNADELVCPLCGPKHDKPITDGLFPPEHPRCRCWVNYELPKVRK